MYGVKVQVRTSSRAARVRRRSRLNATSRAVGTQSVVAAVRCLSVADEARRREIICSLDHSS